MAFEVLKVKAENIEMATEMKLSKWPWARKKS